MSEIADVRDTPDMIIETSAVMSEIADLREPILANEPQPQTSAAMSQIADMRPQPSTSMDVEMKPLRR